MTTTPVIPRHLQVQVQVWGQVQVQVQVWGSLPGALHNQIARYFPHVAPSLEGKPIANKSDLQQRRV